MVGYEELHAAAREMVPGFLLQAGEDEGLFEDAGIWQSDARKFAADELHALGMMGGGGLPLSPASLFLLGLLVGAVAADMAP